jgi:hypothetical protein
MAARTHRRKYVNRPGLSEAARALDCTYSHLRRVVMGERPSPLLKRYRIFKSSQTKPQAPSTK